MIAMRVRLDAGLFLWLSCCLVRRATADDEFHEYYLLTQGFLKEGCPASEVAIQDASNLSSIAAYTFQSKEIFKCAPAPNVEQSGERVQLLGGPSFPHFLKLAVDEKLGCYVQSYKDATCSQKVGQRQQIYQGKCVAEEYSALVSLPSVKVWCQKGPLPEGYFDGGCLTAETIESLNEEFTSQSSLESSCFGACKEWEAMSNKLNELAESSRRLGSLRATAVKWLSAEKHKEQVDSVADGATEMPRRLGAGAKPLTWSSEEEVAQNKRAFEALFEPGNCASSCDERGKKLYFARLVATRFMDCNFRRYSLEEPWENDVEIRL
mmetsp:Transcript_20082/g.36308  ORF Transcript_20082/g.36308 Transcript_20082/m.36308 type:complete len:322 (-) Transcript_20082:56-1021(-)